MRTFLSRIVPALRFIATGDRTPFFGFPPIRKDKQTWSVGEKVLCYAPFGWKTNNPKYRGKAVFEGLGLNDDGFPMHGHMYVVRGYDETSDPPSLHLLGIKGALRSNGSEIGFSQDAFCTPQIFRIQSRIDRINERSDPSQSANP